MTTTVTPYRHKRQRGKHTIEVRVEPPEVDENWRAQARCRGKHPEIWYPLSSDHAGQGIAICNTCPVQAACRIYSFINKEPHGTWGGVDEWERGRRLKIKRGRGRPRNR